MGLDTTHDCWHGPYSSFAMFREALAKAAGYEFGTLTDRFGARPTLYVDWGGVSASQIMGDWDQIPTRIDGTPDPLLVLLAHSDCDGRIPSKFCAALAQRLSDLVPLLPEAEPVHGVAWARRTGQFIAGLVRAAEAGEDVEFH